MISPESGGKLASSERWLYCRAPVTDEQDQTPEPQAEEQAAVGSGEPEPEAEPREAAAEPGEDAEGEEAGEQPDEPVDPLEAAENEAARWKDKCLRTAADLDNFRKRTRRDLVDAERRGREDLLRDLLPVFDNLERAAAHAETASEVKSLADGIGMVMRQFADTLAKLGVERIEAVGNPFDPAVHEAIQHLETDEHPPGAVANEVQAGYRAGERLIRPALVVVAKGSPDGPASAGPSDEPPEPTDD